MDLEHTDNNFNDLSCTELFQFSRQFSLHYNGRTLGNRTCAGKTIINVFFRDREAHGIFLVSVCSPVNCVSCHGLDVSIITVSRRGTAVASCFLLLSRTLQITLS